MNAIQQIQFTNVGSNTVVAQLIGVALMTVGLGTGLYRDKTSDKFVHQKSKLGY